MTEQLADDIGKLYRRAGVTKFYDMGDYSLIFNELANLFGVNDIPQLQHVVTHALNLPDKKFARVGVALKKTLDRAVALDKRVMSSRRGPTRVFYATGDATLDDIIRRFFGEDWWG